MRHLTGVMLFFCLAAQAQELPNGKELLGRVAKAYNQAHSYHVEAVVTNRITGEAGPAQGNPAVRGAERDVIDVAYRAPGLIRVEHGSNPRVAIVFPITTDDTPYQPDFDQPIPDQLPESAGTASPQPDPKRQRAQRLTDIGFADYGAIEDGLSGAATLRQESVELDGTPIPCWVVEASYAHGVRRTFWVDSAKSVVLREVRLTPVSGAHPGVDFERTITIQKLAWNAPLDDSLFAPHGPELPEPDGRLTAIPERVCKDPGYTEEAHIAHLAGVITLKFTFDPQGRPANIQASNHLGLGLDELALDCLSEWRFDPRNGGRLPSYSVRTFSFNAYGVSDWHLGSVSFQKEDGLTRPVFLKADYPGRADDARLFIVTLRANIDAQGIPRDIQASGDPKWAKQASAIVGKWRFTPGLRDGQPAEAKATFQLVHGRDSGVRVMPAGQK